MASPVRTTIAPDRVAVPDRSGLSSTDALMLLTCVLWGVNYTVVKYGTEQLDALAYNGARIALAIVAFAALALRRRGRRIAPADAAALLALGLLGHGVYQYLFAEGVARTRAGSAALVLAATPAFVAIIGRLLGVERVGRRGYAGIALSLAGIAVVVSGGAARGAHTADPRGATLTGNLMILAGGICWSLYAVLLKRFTHRVSLVDISAITLLGGGIPLLLFSLPQLRATHWGQVHWLTWGAIVYSGLGSLVLGYLGWYRGVRVLGPTATAVYTNLQPVVALLVSWWLLAEVPTAWQGLGAVTIIGGVILTRS